MAKDTGKGRSKSGRSQGAALAAVEIRDMALEDLPGVFALGESVFLATEAPNLYRTWDEYELIDYYSSDGEFCFVAELDDRLVGFVIGTVIEKRKSAWTYGYLVWLGVEPELEGQGVARKLVARLTDTFIEAGARIMMVDTNADNDKALAFFERAGFGQPEEHVYLTRNLTTLPEYKRYREQEAAVEQSRKALRRRNPTRGGRR
jgi:ribosomal protein S18 acetylase RimI-like enzyme